MQVLNLRGLRILTEGQLTQVFQIRSLITSLFASVENKEVAPLSGCGPVFKEPVFLGLGPRIEPSGSFRAETNRLRRLEQKSSVGPRMRSGQTELSSFRIAFLWGGIKRNQQGEGYEGTEGQS